MIDGADLELFAQSLQHANTTHSGAGLDAALVEVGWHDALAEDRRAAISIQFEQQGRANATSSALDHVVTGALGRDEPIAAVLPAIGSAGQQPYCWFMCRRSPAATRRGRAAPTASARPA